MSRSLAVSDPLGSCASAEEAAFSCTRRYCGLGTISVRASGVLDHAAAQHLDQLLIDAQDAALLVVLDLGDLLSSDSAGEDVVGRATVRATQLARQLVVLRGAPISSQARSTKGDRPMPDEHGKTKTDDDAQTETSLHAYKDGREEDVKGDVDALKSNDPKRLQQSGLEDDDELNLAHDKE